MLILADVRDIETELWVRSEDTEDGTGEVCVDDENGQCEDQDAKLSLWKVTTPLSRHRRRRSVVGGLTLDCSCFGRMLFTQYRLT
jgi:hypothetical protein